ALHVDTGINDRNIAGIRQHGRGRARAVPAGEQPQLAVAPDASQHVDVAVRQQRQEVAVHREVGRIVEDEDVPVAAAAAGSDDDVVVENATVDVGPVDLRGAAAAAEDVESAGGVEATPARGTEIADLDVRRIQQQRPGLAARRAGVHVRLEV